MTEKIVTISKRQRERHLLLTHVTDQLTISLSDIAKVADALCGCQPQIHIVNVRFH